MTVPPKKKKKNKTTVLKLIFSVSNCRHSRIKSTALRVSIILIKWVYEKDCLPSPCEFCENPAFLKCGSGHSTSADEALIWRETSNAVNHVSHWSSTLTSPQPLLLLLQQLSVSKYRQCSGTVLCYFHSGPAFLQDLFVNSTSLDAKLCPLNL